MERKAYVSESNDWLAFTPSPTANGRREILLTLAMDCASMSEDSTPGVEYRKLRCFYTFRLHALQYHEKTVLGMKLKVKVTAL